MIGTTISGRRGRRPAKFNPKERKRHLLVLALRTVKRWPVTLIMRFFDIARRTISVWCRRAKGYTEAATTQSLIESSGVEDVLLALGAAA